MTTEALLQGSFDDLLVGRIEGRFVIPGYQRGYRWGRQEVTRLLDDIRDSTGSTYYLQPVVVKATEDGAWELIDGQQRLTTLFLILRYIREHALPNAKVGYTLEYETRERSGEFLLRPDSARARENIDFFHIHEAWECIGEWFEQPGRDLTAEAIGLYSALADRVKVIWYVAPDDVTPSDLFRRLNVGRIPLTDAELVKALVLSPRPGLVDRSLALAAEWDAIERDLRVPEVWAFLTGRAGAQATHIGLLLDTLAGDPPHERPTFHTFDTLRPRIAADAEAFWNQVVDLHSLVLGWYEDRALFHKIGFLVAAGVPFAELLHIAEGTRKTEFGDALDERIRSRLRISRDQLGELDFESSRDRSKQALALLLVNVETVRTATGSSERYSFENHAKGSWSLEHIHAQNAGELTSVEEWSAWLELHAAALDEIPGLPPEQVAALQADVGGAVAGELSRGRFLELERELSPLFAVDGSGASEEDLHTIANLALLDSPTNSALSNSKFEVKRLAVLDRDRRGVYIPVCTRNVFLKYYTRERAQQLHYWGRHDREAYLAEIETRLSPYFLPEPSAVETEATR